MRERRVEPRFGGAEQRSERPDDDFLREEAENEGDRRLPEAVPRGREQRRDHVPEAADEALLPRVRDAGGQVRHRPHHDDPAEDPGSGLSKEHHSALRGAPDDRAQRGRLVGGQLDEQVVRLSAEERSSEEPCGDHGDDHAEHIERKDDRRRVAPVKGPGEKDVHRQARRTAHERDDHQRQKPVPGIVDNPRCGDGGDVAAEAHDHRDEALSVQADHRHDPVHHEDAPGHVPRLLEHRDGGEEQHDLRNENQHRPHAADDPVRHER